MGFSTTGRMVGSSAIVGWVESDGTAMMKRYYLGGTSPALVVKDQGNVSLVEGSSSVVVESSRFYMSFQLDMDQPSSRLVFSVGPNGFSPIGPDYRLMEHRNKIATSINYSTDDL
ncbi:hypothetical protein F8388_007828 [Cannabis sativa]|uniref:DOMON domain-containing protein n=1 Tax=Cannabis sativa TaxID=3483 RepID=A0A7J6FTG7_CANSA|nr:hypothetical protein F8388_007828 [Cannabis sativa]